MLLGSLSLIPFYVLLYGPILLVTVLIHELGHSLAAQRSGMSAHGIVLWPLGGLAFIGHGSGPKIDLFVSLAGPLTHIPQVIFWMALLVPTRYASMGVWTAALTVPDPHRSFFVALLASACQLNIALALFNLFLPAYPLDGGRILADSLLLLGVSVPVTAKITAGAAVALGSSLLVLALFQQRMLTVMVAVWMLNSTWQLIQHIQSGTEEQHPLFHYSEDVEAPLIVGGTK